MSYEDAKKQEKISFTLEDISEINGQDEIRLIELSNNDNSFKLNKIVNYPVNALSSAKDLEEYRKKHIVRQISVNFPRELSSAGYAESFGLTFTNIVNSNNVTSTNFEKSYISNDDFVSNFLKIGKQEYELVNFGFTQTYL